MSNKYFVYAPLRDLYRVGKGGFKLKHEQKTTNKLRL